MIERDDALAEIAHIEQGLSKAMRELNERLLAGRRDPDTDDLMQHCREMAVLLKGAVADLGHGEQADMLRQVAGHMAAGLVMLEREYKGSGMH